MDYTKSLYTTGEFAKMMGINRRTLHYYNDIGLFRPQDVDRNGYHHYSPLQAIDLELILTFRKMGLSIAEIMKYAESPSESSFQRILRDKKEVLDLTIRRLQDEKRFLERKSMKLDLAMKAVHGEIEEIDLPEQGILLSDPIGNCTKDNWFMIASDFSKRLKKLYGLYDNFGSRISISNVRNKAWNTYDRFYALVDPGMENDVIMEKGHYIRAFSIGSWDRLGDVYSKIDGYARRHHLELDGYAYEEGLNEMSLERSEDYVTMIHVKCRPSSR